MRGQQGLPAPPAAAEHIGLQARRLRAPPLIHPAHPGQLGLLVGRGMLLPRFKGLAVPLVRLRCGGLVPPVPAYGCPDQPRSAQDQHREQGPAGIGGAVHRLPAPGQQHQDDPGDQAGLARPAAHPGVAGLRDRSAGRRLLAQLLQVGCGFGVGSEQRAAITEDPAQPGAWGE